MSSAGDVPPPEEVTKKLEKYPYAAADALKGLRTHYPIDEDAAIMQRLEREESEMEKDNPAELMQRAEKLGLYKTAERYIWGETGSRR